MRLVKIYVYLSSFCPIGSEWLSNAQDGKTEHCTSRANNSIETSDRYKNKGKQP